MSVVSANGTVLKSLLPVDVEYESDEDAWKHIEIILLKLTKGKRPENINVTLGDYILLEGPFPGLKTYKSVTIMDSPGWADIREESPNNDEDNSSYRTCASPSIIQVRDVDDSMERPYKDVNVLIESTPLSCLQKSAAACDVFVVPSGASGRLVSTKDLIRLFNLQLLFGSEYHSDNTAPMFIATCFINKDEELIEGIRDFSSAEKALKENIFSALPHYALGDLSSDAMTVFQNLEERATILDMSFVAEDGPSQVQAMDDFLRQCREYSLKEVINTSASRIKAYCHRAKLELNKGTSKVLVKKVQNKLKSLKEAFYLGFDIVIREMEDNLQQSNYMQQVRTSIGNILEFEDAKENIIYYLDMCGQYAITNWKTQALAVAGGLITFFESQINRVVNEVASIVLNQTIDDFTRAIFQNTDHFVDEARQNIIGAAKEFGKTMRIEIMNLLTSAQSSWMGDQLLMVEFSNIIVNSFVQQFLPYCRTILTDCFKNVRDFFNTWTDEGVDTHKTNVKLGVAKILTEIQQVIVMICVWDKPAHFEEKQYV